MPASIRKSPEEIALLLTLRPGRTDAARKLSERVLFRLECSMWIRDAAKGT